MTEPDFIAWLEQQAKEGTTVTIEGWPDMGRPEVVIRAGATAVGGGETVEEAIESI